MDIDITVDKEKSCVAAHVSGKIDAVASEDLEDRLLGMIENGEKNHCGCRDSHNACDQVNYF